MDIHSFTMPSANTTIIYIESNLFATLKYNTAFF